MEVGVNGLFVILLLPLLLEQVMILMTHMRSTVQLPWMMILQMKMHSGNSAPLACNCLKCR